jgi:hypothetical protein
MSQENKHGKVSLAEQIANVTNVALRMAGCYVVQKQNPANGEWTGFTLNPLMSDGGIQPPGPPLYGPILHASAAAAEEHMVSWAERMRKFQIQNPDAGLIAVPTLRVAEAAHAALESTVYPRTALGKARFGEHPTAAHVLALSPEILGLVKPSDDQALAPNWVAHLGPEEPVDVVLDSRGDGISEDSFITTAGALFRAGFGELSYERGETGCVVYAETLIQFCRIADVCQ